MNTTVNKDEWQLAREHDRALTAHDAAWERMHAARLAGSPADEIQELREDVAAAARVVQEARRAKEHVRGRCPTCGR